MANQDFSRTKILNNIPSKKLDEILLSIAKSNDTEIHKNIKTDTINRYAASNIPVDYWQLHMSKNFTGDPRLLKRYEEYVTDLKASYFNGTSICLAGGHGAGKTMTSCCILKAACIKGFTSLYTTMTDVVSALTQSNGDEKLLAKRELTMVDFLFLDELDYRFFSTDLAKDLYGRTFETVIRTRLQNKLPTILATNSPNIKENFVSLFKDSLGSLLSKVEVFTVMPGIEDFRKKVVTQ